MLHVYFKPCSAQRRFESGTSKESTLARESTFPFHHTSMKSGNQLSTFYLSHESTSLPLQPKKDAEPKMALKYTDLTDAGNLKYLTLTECINSSNFNVIIQQKSYFCTYKMILTGQIVQTEYIDISKSKKNHMMLRLRQGVLG